MDMRFKPSCHPSNGVNGFYYLRDRLSTRINLSFLLPRSGIPGLVISHD